VSGAVEYVGNAAHIWTNWQTLPPRFRSEATRLIYIGPDGSRWDLAGPDAGKQGVQFAEELQGHYHLPFEHLLTETAYQRGATYERSNINKRIINCGAMIGSQTRKLNATQYRMVESRWWQAWPVGVPGWLGSWTPTCGWRWIAVMQARPCETSFKKDPVYAGNNTATHDMQILACSPVWAKPALYQTFTAHKDNFTKKKPWDEQVISIANRSDMPAAPKFLYTAGKAWVSDGMTARLVELPLVTVKEAPVLVDTDEDARTVTGAADPVDNAFYQLIRSSRILDFFLHDLGDLGEPVWRRAHGVRFLSMIPPRTVANIKVRHSRPGGQVTVFMPQHYSRPY